MASKAAAQAELGRLRRDIARIEGRLPEADRLVLDGAADAPPEGLSQAACLRPSANAPPSNDIAKPGVGLRLGPRQKRARLRLGASALDAILGGGLPLATLHEIRAGESRDSGSAAGFALALISRLMERGGPASVIWISEADFRRETGGLYAPGLLALGMDPGRIVHVSARTGTEALWAFEAALACAGLDAAICELRQASLDLSVTRRCVLRAREAGVTGLLLRLASQPEPSAAELRFRLAPAPAGQIGRFAAGVGRMAWNMALEKNRGGQTGAFTVEWNAYERCFAERGSERGDERGAGMAGGNKRADPQPLPAAPPDRSPHPSPAGRITPARTGWRRAS